ncbi:uncharacterized protein LOC131235292 isoform X2 [Magnolia sinica]|nr:uncharacterized protein LOC131235292 isoform X2 [Magnolia sinica]
MEAQMKEDIIAEVTQSTQSGGRMLLHHEELNPVSKHSSVEGYWENILLDDVKTPAEVYASLKAEGYNIEYKRVLLTREREALLTDIDAIHSCQDEYVSCIRQLATIICFTICRLISFCVTHWLWGSCLCNSDHLSYTGYGVPCHDVLFHDPKHKKIYATGLRFARCTCRCNILAQKSVWMYFRMRIEENEWDSIALSISCRCSNARP